GLVGPAFLADAVGGGQDVDGGGQVGDDLCVDAVQRSADEIGAGCGQGGGEQRHGAPEGSEEIIRIGAVEAGFRVDIRLVGVAGPGDGRVFRGLGEEVAVIDR